MLVRDIMTKNVITISEDQTILEAQELMRGKSLRRIPVVDDIKRVCGIITVGDVGRASPSEASTLSRYEASYLLSRFKVRDIMTKNVSTVRETSALEDVAQIMYQHRVNSLPVIDDRGCLTGIVTDSDVFRALVRIFGLNQNCTRITIKVEDKVGMLAKVAEAFAERSISIISMTTEQLDDGNYNVTVAVDLSKAGMDVIEALREDGYEVTDITTGRAN